MKLKSRIAAFLIASLCCIQTAFAASDGNPSGEKPLGGTTSTVRVSTVTGIRGATVTVPIRFQGDGSTVEFTADIVFSNTNMTLAVTDPVVPVGGATCLVISPTHVRVSQAAASPLPMADLRYCDIRLKINSTASGGVQPLSIPTATCTDEFSNPFTCLTVPGAVNISGVQTSLADGTNIVIAAYPGTAQETRRLRITNVGSSNLTLNCGLSPTVPGLMLTTAPTNIPPTQSQEAVVTCDMPALGNPDRLSALTCTTSDPVRGVLSYSVTCTTVAPGQPLPGDQLADNLLEAGDQLGAAAAQSTVASNGNEVVALGAPFGGGDGTGRVLLFEAGTQATKSAIGGQLVPAMGTMKRVAMLGPPPRGDHAKGINLDKFGSAVIMNADGSRLAVGAPGSATGGGRVYVYQRPSTVNGWQDLDIEDPTRVVINPPAATGSLVPGEFGTNLALTPAGDLVIGAPATDVGGVIDAGAAFHYRAIGLGFGTSPSVLTSIAPVTGGRFGTALSMGADLLLVGAPFEGANDSNAGATYTFVLMGDTNFGAPTSIPTSSSQPAGDMFGASVLVKDTIILVGSPGESTIAGANSGATRRYRRPSPGGSVIESTIFIPDAGSNQKSGASLATNGDIIIIGAPNADDGLGIGQGRVYVYDVKANPAPQELPAQQLNGIDTRLGDNFGMAVSINSKQAIIGLPLRDLVVPGSPPVVDVGRGDTFILDTVFRTGFE